METAESIIGQLKDMTEHGEIVWRRLNSSQHDGIETSLGPLRIRIVIPMPVAGLLVGYEDDSRVMRSFGSPESVYDLLNLVAPNFFGWHLNASLPYDSEDLSEVLNLLKGSPTETLQAEITVREDKFMTTRSINDVVRVMEIGGDTVQYGMDVNDYLAEGWMLLNVYLNSVPSDHGPAQRPVYVLGWTGDDEPPSDRAAVSQRERGLRELEAIRNMNKGTIVEGTESE